MLFVTDDSREFFSHRLFLENNHVDISLRSTSVEAIEFLKKHTPDIVILDMIYRDIKQNDEIFKIISDKNIPNILFVDEISDNDLIQYNDDFDTIIFKKPVVIFDVIEEINYLLDDKVLEV